MQITAHGALFGAAKNPDKYFESVSKHNADAIEVDVRKKNGKLYIAHFPFFIASKAIPLSVAYEHCKTKNLKINLDIKEFGIVKDCCALAEECGVQDLIYFTGRFMPSDMPYFTCGEVYVNEEFYFARCGVPTQNNLAKIKAYLDSFKNDRIKGINTGYRKAGESYVAEAKRLNLGLSLYTINNTKALSRVVALRPDNITTNRPGIAMQYAKCIHIAKEN